MAPNPGINPSRNATPGFPARCAGGTPSGGISGPPAVVTGCGADNPITFARHSSQYNTSRTGRTHAVHMGLPQLRQYPDASTSGCTAHFIDNSSPKSWDTRPPASPSAGPSHSRGSAASVARAYGRRSDPGLSPAPTSVSSPPAVPANRPDPAAAATGSHTQPAGRLHISRPAPFPDVSSGPLSRTHSSATNPPASVYATKIRTRPARSQA